MLGAAGAGYIPRKMAASMPLMHSIYMADGGRPAAVFVLREKGGPLDTTSELQIGADFVPGRVTDKPVLQKVYWESENEGMYMDEWISR